MRARVPTRAWTGWSSLLAALALALGLPAAATLGACRGAGAAASSPPPRPVPPAEQEAGELRLTRGVLRQRLLLTGELKAARGEALAVPRTSDFQLQLRWLAEDGSAVAAGQSIAEFDNSAFLSKLKEKQLAAASAASELARLEAEGRASAAEKRFTVEQKSAETATARLAATVPQELLSPYDYQDRQIKLQRAESELAKAKAEVETQARTAAADQGVQRVALAAAERDIQAAARALEQLTLKAPRPGVVLIADHPWEGRKFREGDNVWTGMRVATLPDLGSMVVEAALSDVDDGRVTPGDEALCTLDAHPGFSVHGRVAEISPVARESDRAPLLRFFPVRVELDQIDPRRLRPGMSVRVEISGRPAPPALLAPRAAIDFSGVPPRLWLAGGGAVAVRLGPCNAQLCAVAAVEGELRAGQRLQAAPVGTRTAPMAKAPG
ncbi:MAG TPA: efflux RND transporter periplasmic adaptor subunit [Thermoanaerobaculia bacterium]|nr:efflux RND transporter periplasmic adaptor subunit [Thermoanaerobaculia bacterium]